MLTTLKRAALIGLGVSESAKETLEGLAKKGEQNSSEGAKQIRGFFESGEKVEAECRQKMEDICKRVAQTIRIPSRADIERLEKGLADLADKVYRMTPAGGK